MENIYQQAIADAKALRASAMANAKAALQEAFEPKIQEIVRMKLSEELDETEELEEKVEEMEEGMEHDKVEENYEEDGMEETYDELGEAELEEILSELESISEGDEEMEEGEDDLNEAEEEEEEEEEESEEEDEEEGEEEVEGDEIDDETKIIDITLGDLKQVLQSLQAQQVDMGLGDEDEFGGEEATDDAKGIEASDKEDEISLDEILAQLEEEGMRKPEDVQSTGYKAGQQVPDIEEGKKKHQNKEIEEKKKMEDELEEAKNTIAELQESFGEINLLNAKLLYMNKIFKAKSLNESQKIQVVKAFDKATSVKEVKNTYEVLKESVGAKKTQIKESFGYASKPAGVSPTANVIDSDPFVNRWQKLAGL